MMGEMGKLAQFNMMMATEIYTVLSYDAVFEVLRDGARFSLRRLQEEHGPRDGPTRSSRWTAPSTCATAR